MIEELERRLRDAARPERALKEKAYLKSRLEHLGASVPAIEAAVRAVARPRGRRELLAAVRALWRREIHELRVAAVLLLERDVALLQPGDLKLVEALLREARTWALVDELAVHVAGGLVERHPRLADELDRWARDQDFWLRRAALLALLAPLRRGEGDFERFARYADAMLEEKEFFIRKAIGWVLRETGKRRPELVARWLGPRAARASGLTVREAVKRLPEELRARVLARRSR
jgi:3-methyladenine DNA glycosylase AlkD